MLPEYKLLNREIYLKKKIIMIKSEGWNYSCFHCYFSLFDLHLYIFMKKEKNISLLINSFFYTCLQHGSLTG